MKRLNPFTSFVSVVLVTFGVAACAMETGQDEPEVGQVRQAICKGGLPCKLGGGPGGGLGGGVIGGDLEVAPDPPPPTFYCPPREPEYPCGPVLKLVNGEYWCVNSCGGGAFVTHAANPCGLAYPNYYCTSWGSCSCRK